jgi:hypothetical protein
LLWPGWAGRTNGGGGETKYCKKAARKTRLCSSSADAISVSLLQKKVQTIMTQKKKIERRKKKSGSIGRLERDKIKVTW